MPTTTLVNTTIYAQVDSANANTTYGGVLETHEISGESYNNISHTLPLTFTVVTLAASSNDGKSQTILADTLPARP